MGIVIYGSISEDEQKLPIICYVILDKTIYLMEIEMQFAFANLIINKIVFCVKYYQWD